MVPSVSFPSRWTTHLPPPCPVCWVSGSGRPNGLTTRDPRHEARSQRAKSRALAPRGGTDSIEDLQPYLNLPRLVRYGTTTSKEWLLSTQTEEGSDKITLEVVRLVHYRV